MSHAAASRARTVVRNIARRAGIIAHASLFDTPIASRIDFSTAVDGA